MNFKNWLSEDQIDQTIDQTVGKVPPWVKKDLFRDNWLKKQAKSGNSRTPFSDWKNNPGVQAFKNVVWDNKPQCISVKPTDFHSQTLTNMLVRRFGQKSIDSIQNDKLKTDAACQKMSQIPNCQHKPVIMIVEEGKYKLIEGWHRTMCKLLTGAPPNTLQILNDPNLTHSQLEQKLNLNSWTPVQLNAFLGRNKQPANDYTSPTGDYMMPTSEL